MTEWLTILFRSGLEMRVDVAPGVAGKMIDDWLHAKQTRQYCVAVLNDGADGNRAAFDLAEVVGMSRDP